MLRSTATDRGDQEMSVEEWRAAYDGPGQLLPPAEGTEVTDADADGVAAEWVVAPEADAGRTIVYFHGGGYCIGSVLGHQAMVSHLSAAARARVLSVGYRLAPERPHPAALDAAGTGTVYSFTVVRKGQGAYREAAPYVVAYVELTEGPRVMTNIVNCDPDTVRIGTAVTVTFDATDKGTALPRFQPS